MVAGESVFFANVEYPNRGDTLIHLLARSLA